MAIRDSGQKDIIVIPAFNPDTRLIKLVDEIKSRDPDVTVIIVNDGSDVKTGALFEELERRHGCTLLRHTVNRGKGAAIKTASEYISSVYPDRGFTTADADYQHLPNDIFEIAKLSRNNKNCLILGTRDFNRKNVPFKNKWGNRITSAVFRLATGITCSDTQTGLRGIPALFVSQMSNIKGERFDFEMNMLFAAAREGVQLKEVRIDTVYEDGNKATHFHAVTDSLKIFENIAKFCASSLICAFMDVGLFTVLCYFIFGKDTGGVLISSFSARILSGILNFALNKKAVFRETGKTATQGFRYGLLFCSIMLMSGLLSALLSSVMPPTLAKIITDCGLFLLSYTVQSKLIFHKVEPQKIG